MISDTQKALHLLIRDQLSSEDVEWLKTSLKANKGYRQLASKAELYAVAALVEANLDRHQIEVPKDVSMVFKSLALRHKAMSDARYTVLSEIVSLFGQHQIPFVPLKGAALAPMIYPYEHHRPMRDMDILLPRSKQYQAADILREIGFDLPHQQPNRYMRFAHQLPNATIQKNGFTISVELHRDAFASDARSTLVYEEVEPDLRTVQWRDLNLPCLGHEQMLHHVSRHLESLHPGAVLKLANVLDLILYAEKFQEEINWQEIKQHYSHVINSLQCLHLIRPLDPGLIEKIDGVHETETKGLGETMTALTVIFSKQNSFKKKLKLLFVPSDWWLHLYYNTRLNRSLVWIKFIRHPFTVLKWLSTRFYSGLLGG